MLRKLYILSCLLFLAGNTIAQNNPKPQESRRGSRILDDSTKQIYSAETSRFMYEKNLLDNQKVSFPADTSIDNFHEYSVVHKSHNKLVDLGNIGSATRPLFYELPATLGARLGVDVYQVYAPVIDSIKYYDTHSPYSRVYYVQGGRNQQVIKMEFNRNVNPRWNLGAEALNFSTERPFGFPAGISPGSFDTRVRATVHWSAVFRTRYYNKDSTYQLLAHYAHLNHFARELGGIKVIQNDDGSAKNVQTDLFNYRKELAQLENAIARDFRNTWHLYHQYKLAQGFQIFHSFTREKRNNNFNDYTLASVVDTAFYKPFTGNLQIIQTQGDTLSHNIIFTLYENIAGIKGRFNRFDYRLFARNRTYNARYEYADLQQKGSENFLGIALDYQFSNRADLHAEAEYMLFKDYRIEGTYFNRFFKIQYQRYNYSPSLVERQTINFPFAWQNDFKNISADILSGALIYENKKVYFSPFTKITNLTNYVYFNKNAVPEQAGDLVQLLQIGLNFKFKLGKFITENEGIFSTVTGADVLRIPTIFANTRFYYENIVLKANQIQLGFQVHYKSSYYANYYMPVTGQFYLQDTQGSNNFQIKAYPVIDLFGSIKIKNVRLFGRFSNAGQGFPANGYFTTPYYTALPRTFGFGATWMFFD
jgi:hypothetical protein